jgi:hypothetical protein
MRILACAVLAFGVFAGSQQAPPRPAPELDRLGPQVGSRVPASQQPAADRKDTPHLTLTTSSSDAVVAPGTRFSLWVDITPKPKMHVYAPEQKDYFPIEISLEPDDTFKVLPPVFPKGEKFFFAPLKETQLVFSKPFRIVQDVTVNLSAPVRQRATAAGATLTIKGTLRYQACDDKVCYIPQSIPLSWIVGLRPLAQSPPS